MSRSLAAAFTTLVVALAGAGVAGGQQDDEPITLSANLVVVTVVVRDARGALVTDLRATDFVVYEDGVRQDIDAVLSERDAPLRVVLLFDTSLSVRDRLDFERRAADRFFASVLRPADQAGVVSVSTDWKLVQPLTAQLGELTRATAALKASGITSLFGALDGVARYLGTAEGRRVAIVISDGHDTGSRLGFDETLERIQRSNLVIYGIGSRGTSAATDPAVAIGAATLQRLAAETGGAAIFPTESADRADEARELDLAYQRIAEELRSQYVITYYARRPPGDGGYRQIRVETMRPGTRVAARRGYFAR
jgi:Ca-activated chloride channel family protein